MNRRTHGQELYEQELHEQELHEHIENTIRWHGHEHTRTILAAWLLALTRRLGEDFIIGPYRVTVRKLH